MARRRGQEKQTYNEKRGGRGLIAIPGGEDRRPTQLIFILPLWEYPLVDVWAPTSWVPAQEVIGK